MSNLLKSTPADALTIQGISISGTPSVNQVPVASSTSSATWSTIATSSRNLPISDIISILATSSNGHFQRHSLLPSIIQLKGRGFGTIADAKTNVATTWSITNSSGIGSASSTNDKLQLVHANSGTDNFYGGTGTAPYYQRSFTRPIGTRFGCVFRFSAADMTASNAGARVGYATAGVPIAMVYFVGLQFRWLTNSSSQGPIFTFNDNAAIAAGVWVNIEIGSAGDYVFAYVQSSSDVEPTTGWAVTKRGTLTTSEVTWLEVFTVIREGGAGTPTAEIYGYRTYCNNISSLIPAQGIINSTGFPTTSDSIIIGVFDYGTSKGLPDITNTRLILADSINKLPGDSASWTWSFTGSDSASPAAATTYQSAVSLNLKQPNSDTTETVARQYWTLRAICSSTSSIQPGSLDLSRMSYIKESI